MPISVQVTKGLLSPKGEREVFPLVAEALLKAHGLSGKNIMRHPMRSTAAILAAATLALAGATTAADSANTTPAAVTRIELAHSDVPGTDLETRLYLITYPPGAAAPLHHHPVEGLGYILEGAAQSAYGQNPPVTLTEGQSFVDLADVPHTLFVNTNPRGPLRFLIAYTVKKGAAVIEIP